MDWNHRDCFLLRHNRLLWLYYSPKGLEGQKGENAAMNRNSLLLIIIGIVFFSFFLTIWMDHPVPQTTPEREVFYKHYLLGRELAIRYVLEKEAYSLHTGRRYYNLDYDWIRSQCDSAYLAFYAEKDSLK